MDNRSAIWNAVMIYFFQPTKIGTKSNHNLSIKKMIQGLILKQIGEEADHDIKKWTTGTHHKIMENRWA